MDIFTVYFLIWQVTFLIAEWELQSLPLISFTSYRRWLRMLPAFMAYFFLSDFTNGVDLSPDIDIIYCLHTKCHNESSRVLDELSTGGIASSIIGFCYTWNFDDNETDQTQNNRASLGTSDFLILNLMLLLILPPVSSMATKVYVAIGHIIAIQIGQKRTSRFGCSFNQYLLSALPLPVFFSSLYAILLNAFVQY
ncbi:unnamed protein product [Rotaria socialis]|uniref:Uncharacterized protein n=2 Tax=Rotaria socialis TaxID=392032 RepID=A0A817W447_9BILA|nr:unnamed protein product [Rotaria socialis]